MRNLKKPFPMAVPALLTLLLAACNPQGSEGTNGSIVRLSIATGDTGGVFYPLGGGIAKIIGEYIPNVQATAEVTGASVDNLKFLRDRKADLAFTTADTLADGVNGTGMFKDNRIPIRTLALLYKNYTHVVTLASGPIKTIKDLKGHTVSTGSAGSGAEVTALRVLEAYGLDPEKDIRRQRLTSNVAVDALKDGKIDAFFWSGGLPTAAIQDLAHTSGITIRMLSNDDVLEALQSKYGKSLYVRGNVPKTMYPGLDSDVGVVSIPNLLVVHADMDENLVYEITKTLFEHQKELVAIHPEAANLSLESAVKDSPAPFHSGAIRYYKEQHVWPE
ncbi:MAG TPA: TAXI family TRAP transporter solute-binding subunit [Terriglobia bacterium]|nr:TAXI family TRAP transporter solute-binding subunit [Terriglobia bacterium]